MYVMSKKKRTKVYKGSNAAMKPTVTRVSAVNRHPVHQWWVDHKLMAKPIAIISAIVVGLIIMIIGIISLI